MAFRFRKSLRLAKGVSLNFSRGGMGISAGVPGARISVGPSGTRVTGSIPGTGISWTRSLTSGAKGRTGRSSSRMSRTEIVGHLCNRTDNVGIVVRSLRSQMPQVFQMAKDGAKQHGWPLEVHMSIFPDSGQTGGNVGMRLAVCTPGSDPNPETGSYVYSIATITQRMSPDTLIASLIDNIRELVPGGASTLMPMATAGGGGCCLLLMLGLTLIPLLIVLIH